MSIQVVQSKDEKKVVYILHELAKQEGVTPVGWMMIRILQEAKRRGLIKPDKPIRPSEETEMKLQCESIDEWVYDD